VPAPEKSMTLTRDLRSTSAPQGQAIQLPRILRMRDLVLLIIGTVIGSGIFLVPGAVLKSVGSSLPLAFAVWIIGGVLSLLGALTDGELSAMKPQAGGFMTAWSVTQTNRYRAAIEEAGITDGLSLIATSDIWPIDYGVLLQEKDPTPMLQFCVGMSAARVTTSLLILYGEADLRVPMLQGRELFVLLAERGKTVRMVTYPGSPHFPRLFEQRRDLLKEIQDWLQKYNP